MGKHADVDTVVNFASSRSVFTSTMELMTYPQIKSIAIIAEGVPERRAREILHVAKQKGITKGKFVWAVMASLLFSKFVRTRSPRLLFGNILI